MFPVHVLPLAAGGDQPLHALQTGLRLQRPADCRGWPGVGLLETFGQEKCAHRDLSGEEVSVAITSLSLYRVAFMDSVIGLFAPIVQ